MLQPFRTSICRGRLAPSPTGLLHLGNALSLLLAWLLARSQKGSVVLRVDDIDPARSKPQFCEALARDLAWLGLDWDEKVLQSARLPLYAEALEHLEQKGLVYKCFCSRKELRLLASAPHPGDLGAPYPGTCRGLSREQIARNIASGRPYCLRLRAREAPFAFEDLVMGPQCFTASGLGGDFALRRSDGVYAYQLASVVDDGTLGITQVLRGRDLLPSAGRQLMLFEALNLPPPQFAHTPLLLDEFGERLAKRHGALSLAALRQKGVSPREICGFLGFLAGANPGGRAKAAHELLAGFSPANIPRGDITLQPNSSPAWLK